MAESTYQIAAMDWRDREDLTDTEVNILKKLEEGRATPAYLASELDRSQEYIRERLRELKRLELVEQVHRGLYEIGDSEKSD